MTRELVEEFAGPQGKAKVFEVASTNSIGVEKVEYQIEHNGQTRIVGTMSEASTLACELSGNPRFLHPSA